MWMLGLYRLYKQQTVCAHRLILYVMLFRFLSCICGFTRAFFCQPLLDPIMNSILQLCGNIVYSTFSFSLFLVLAMGISITNSMITRPQIMKILAVTLFSYLSHCAFYIFAPSFPFILGAARCLLGACYGVLAGLVGYYSVRNIQLLNAAAQNVADERLADIRRGLRTKVSMYLAYGPVVSCYFACQAAAQIMEVVYSPSYRSITRVEGIGALAALVLHAVVCAIFHPCFFTAAFQLGHVEVYLVMSVCVRAAYRTLATNVDGRSCRRGSRSRCPPPATVRAGTRQGDR